MKTILTASLALLAMGGAALAADLPPPPPVAPAAPPAFSWEHTIYVGIQLGYGIGYKFWDAGLAGNTTHQVRGFLAGAQIGINVQRGNLVVGAEADIDWSNITGTSTCGVTFICTSDINWIATWTGRVGIDVGPLLYLEGGVAVAGEDFLTSDGATTAVASIRNFGWTVGGGVEFAVGTDWLVDLEYSYVNFGIDPVLLTGGGALAIDLTQSLHMVRLGVSRAF